ncbi:hypothetical protein ACQ4PT_045084 [Festuca glaucescens]
MPNHTVTNTDEARQKAKMGEVPLAPVEGEPVLGKRGGQNVMAMGDQETKLTGHKKKKAEELFHEHDVQAILEIELPQPGRPDRIAWQPEKNGVFNVKSAYHLALWLKHQNWDTNSCSTVTSGDRPIWDHIWKAKVQPKIRVFGWRVATDTLATRKNKRRRTLEVDDCCAIYGIEVEDAHHATVRCTKARALRNAMRKVWKLPDEESFRFTGLDWLQILLGKVDEDMKAKTLMVLWRAWHLRNDIIHEQGRESIAQSVAFLQSYSIEQSPRLTPSLDVKGKSPMFAEEGQPTQAPVPQAKNSWSAPPEGWIKVNTDASFSGSGIPAGAGAVARDHNGKVVIASCSPIARCSDADEAEAKAALLGVKLMVGMGHQKIILELDSAIVVAALRSGDADRSKYWATIDETKKILKESYAFCINHERRERAIG